MRVPHTTICGQSTTETWNNTHLSWPWFLRVTGLLPLARVGCIVDGAPERWSQLQCSPSPLSSTASLCPSSHTTSRWNLQGLEFGAGERAVPMELQVATTPERAHPSSSTMTRSPNHLIPDRAPSDTAGFQNLELGTVTRASDQLIFEPSHWTPPCPTRIHVTRHVI